jgi:hypothetical protein
MVICDNGIIKLQILSLYGKADATSLAQLDVIILVHCSIKVITIICTNSTVQKRKLTPYWNRGKNQGVIEMFNTCNLILTL